ncbi:MAG: HlyD family secretion protein [Bacteroidetes bacterium CG2_30_32_10]|nr:MAG: HlyD family secretion protein [Bacteroidetes bacterium CG2_30_32_10]
MKKYLYLLVGLTILTACSSRNHKSDAYGTFESTEITISSEANGKILKLDLHEGDVLNAGVLIGFIDTTDLVLKKEQLLAQRKAISNKSANVFSQIEVQKQQKKNLLIEKTRIENLLKNNAATPKQLDDINGSLDLIDKQIMSIQTQNSSVFNETEGITKQIEQIEQSIKKSYIINPLAGTVLTKFAEPNEITTFGKALYKIADLSEMTLRIYVSESQLSSIKIGQKVQVLIDKNAKELAKMEGIITWISQNAEFTPKIIQTKEERVNLVYAVKVRVKNEGSLKIGMPGEVNFK